MRTKKNPIALNLPEVAALLIVYGRHVVQEMTNNPWFPSPEPPLATVTADLDALEASEATVLSGTRGTAALRDLDRAAVESDLVGLKGHVGAVVAKNPAQAVAIIESAGMSPKRYTRPDKPDLAAVMGPVPGQAVVRAKAVGRGAAYEWQSSADGGKTWVAMGLTTVARTSLPGLVQGTTYLFRFRATFRNVTRDWSQSVSLFAH
jgi:hypothetical protein